MTNPAEFCDGQSRCSERYASLSDFTDRDCSKEITHMRAHFGTDAFGDYISHESL